MNEDLDARPDPDAALVEGASAAVHAPHSMLAEVVVHKALLAIDPSAEHLGGNAAVTDHRIKDNKYWCNTKTGWIEERRNVLGHAPVNWEKGLDPDRPKQSLDLIAVVPLRAERVASVLTANGVTFTWDPFDWFLFPASELYEVRRIEGSSKVRREVDLAWARSEDYVVSVECPLTIERLIRLAERNQPDIRRES